MEDEEEKEEGEEQLYRTFNDRTQTQDWLNINFNAVLSSRQTSFSINKEKEEEEEEGLLLWLFVVVLCHVW